MISKKALQFDSDNMLAYVAKGESLSEPGRYEEKLAAIKRAIGLNSYDPDAYKGKVFERPGKSRQVRQNYEKRDNLAQVKISSD